MSKFARLLILALFALAGAIPAGAQAPRVDQVDIFEAGVYEAGPTNSLQFVSKTTDIPGRIGTKFGFRYAIRGPQSALPVEILLVTKLPQRLGQVDPATGQRRFRIEDIVTARVGGANVSGYSFDAAWEIVLGEWTFEVWIAGAKRAEQRFNIVRP
jgi:hypothetical protein